MIYVLYHAHCKDGFGAAMAAYAKFKATAKYFPVSYGKAVPQEVFGDKEAEIYILDFSYPRDVLETLRSRCKSLMVVDHHKTSMEALEGFPEAIFDMSKSGAVLSWEFFHPGVKVPTLLLHVQDRDLWQFAMPNTEEVNLGLESFMHRHQNAPAHTGVMAGYHKYLASGNDSFLDELKKEGGAILDYRTSLVNNAASRVNVAPYKGYKVGVVNCPDFTSEVGAEIYNDDKLGVDFFMGWMVNKRGEVVLSLRSKNPTGIDVSLIAQELGGGGHRHASGVPKVGLSFILDLLGGNL